MFYNKKLLINSESPAAKPDLKPGTLDLLERLVNITMFFKDLLSNLHAWSMPIGFY